MSLLNSYSLRECPLIIDRDEVGECEEGAGGGGGWPNKLAFKEGSMTIVVPFC